MAMNTERSAKDNFTMPCDLRWGNQRFLRCMKVNSDGQISPPNRFTSGASRRSHSVSKHHRRISAGEESSYDGSRGVGSIQPPLVDHGIAEVREKIMFDLQTAADKMKDAIFKRGIEDGEVPVDAPPPRDESQKPWSLRTRRAGAASCKTTPFGGFSKRNVIVTGTKTAGGNRLTVAEGKPSTVHPPTKSPADDKPPTNITGDIREREDFSVTLSKREIEEDFFTFVSHRPPRRPKKRPKTVQKKLDTLFPGLWLTEVTPDMYKVTEEVP